MTFPQSESMSEDQAYCVGQLLQAVAPDENFREVALRDLVARRLDRIPLPGSGSTIGRWRCLAQVASYDLALAKWFEGHTDALAIQAELAPEVPVAHGIWATWCAEPPQARLELRESHGHGATLSGLKGWCSAAGVATHAVVSAWDASGAPRLATVDLRQPGIDSAAAGWQAVGMAATRSHTLRFEQVPAQPLGNTHAYVERPGFWQGGAGIAACWWGGARGIAQSTRQTLAQRADPHALAHLGAIDVALAQGAALLRESAALIDEQPGSRAMALALRVRAAVEKICGDVMEHAGRALGAGPLCGNAGFAQAMADLPVFLRQSHAERDLAALGAQILKGPQESTPPCRPQRSAWEL